MALSFVPSGAGVYSTAKGRAVKGTLTFDSSYPTGGEAYTAGLFGLSAVDSIDFGEVVGGYAFEHDKTNKKLKVYSGGAASGTVGNEAAHTHPVALDTGVSDATSGGTPAGSNSAPTYTDDATSGALNLASPLFSGTGLTAAGQTMTTTDNQTMTLNQCAGMWLIPATGSSAPMLILSNTAVTGAPAVFTVQGTAATDAGAYKVVKSLTVGTVSAPTFTGTPLATHTHGPGTLGDAASGAGSSHSHSFSGSGAVGAEVANATNLSTVAVEVEVDGV